MAKKKTSTKKSSKKKAAKSSAGKSSKVRATASAGSGKKKSSKKKSTAKAAASRAKPAKSGNRKRKHSSSNAHNASKVSSNGTVASTRGRRKSALSAKELRQYRSLLMLKRAEILGDMDSMSRDALNSDAANLSHMPMHMADVGSDNFEQELTLGLVESERKLVTEINEALVRIGEGTYGVCEATGVPIGKARLDAKPWAKYCIEAAREMERTGRRW